MFSVIKNLERFSNYKVRSGVLQLALGIGLIISIICASMIMLVYYSRLSFLQQTIQDKLQRNATSGIQYLLANRESTPYGEVQTLDLFKEENDSVDLVRRPWGLFDLLVSSAVQGKHEFTKAALIAAEPDSIGLSCIFIPSNHAVTYLAGKASITGYAYLPNQGLNAGFIDGKDFKNDRLIHGKLKESKPLLPQLDTIRIHAIRQIMEKKSSPYLLKEIGDLEMKRNFSFKTAETAYYFNDDPIDIADSVSGKLIIHSNNRITLNANALVKDVILIAPDIKIEDGFNGRIQCFASHSIVVGKDSKLRYPSVLALMGKERDSLIVLRPGAIVEGVVVVTGYDQLIGSSGVFKIEKDAVFHGMAYCNGAANIEGSLWGHITLRNFQATIGEAASANYFVDGEINSSKRSADFPASLLWACKRKWVIAKWME